MKKNLMFFFMIGSFMLTSCVKEEPVSCVLPNPEISVTPIVISGESINLRVIEEFEDESRVYQWTGPNNFSSTLKNPIITNATLAMAGEYKLKVSKGICSSDEIKSNVKVINNTVTCDAIQDRITLTGIGYESLYQITSNGVPNNQYQIRGGSQDIDVELLFNGTEKPVTGIYTIVSATTALTANTVHVKAIVGINSNYFAKSGDVLVYYNSEGKVTAKFCSVPFSYSTNTSTDTVGTCKITQNQ